MTLTPDQRTRYARQILLPEVGGAGQERLLTARVLVVGAGGLGSPLLLYLAASGVGQITLADDDTVALSNLQRQVLYDTAEVGTAKAIAARERLIALNPDLDIVALENRINAGNVGALVARHDVIVDCCDNFHTRFLLSDACRQAEKPFVSAAVQGFDGLVAVFDPAQGGPCYRCFNPAQPPRGTTGNACDDVGILGAMAGVVGAWQAMTVIKLILGLEADLVGSLRIFNGLSGTQRTSRIPRDPACPGCGSPL